MKLTVMIAHFSLCLSIFGNQESNKGNFKVLPREITSMILGYLNPQELAKAEGLSKYFHSLASEDELWERHLREFVRGTDYEEFLAFAMPTKNSLKKMKQTQKLPIQLGQWKTHFLTFTPIKETKYPGLWGSFTGLKLLSTPIQNHEMWNILKQIKDQAPLYTPEGNSTAMDFFIAQVNEYFLENKIHWRVSQAPIEVKKFVFFELYPGPSEQQRRTCAYEPIVSFNFGKSEQSDHQELHSISMKQVSSAPSHRRQIVWGVASNASEIDSPEFCLLQLEKIENAPPQE